MSAQARPLSARVAEGALAAFVGLLFAVATRRFLLGALGPRIVWVTFYPAVVLVSVRAGWAPGAAAGAGAVLIAAYGWRLLWDHPFLNDRYDWLGAAVFLANCVMISLVAESARRARARAVAAKDEAERSTASLRESEQRYRALFETSSDAIMTTEIPGLRFSSFNPAAVAMFGVADARQAATLGPADLSPAMQPGSRPSDVAAKEQIERALREGSAFFEWVHRRLGGGEFPATVLLTRVDVGGKRFVQATVRDVSRQKQVEAELALARKLEAVGQLAAGIAHEINTPTQFVGDSLLFLEQAFAGYATQSALLARCTAALEAAGHQALAQEVRSLEQEADLAYFDANVPAALARCADGVGRISSIVRAMKEFAHPDQRQPAPADLNRALQSTLLIARNEYKYVADLEFDLGELPLVRCHVGDLNQAFLNLIVNAAHAIAEQSGPQGPRGRITVRTRAEGAQVRVEIADTGTGIPEAVRHRVFEPFFTTKEPGKGTGQGLAIARSIVVNRHHGTLTFDTREGAGTTFRLTLPVGAPGPAVA